MKENRVPSQFSGSLPLELDDVVVADPRIIPISLSSLLWLR